VLTAHSRARSWTVTRRYLPSGAIKRLWNGN